MKSPIIQAYPVEGEPYEVTTSVGIEYATDYRLGVELPDGRHMIHRTIVFRGRALHQEEGAFVFDARPLAVEMAARVRQFGEIQLALWEDAPAPVVEE